jgi:predicted Rdx family selenoprotein
MTPEEKAFQLVNAVGVMVAMFVVDEIIESRKEDSAFDDRHLVKKKEKDLLMVWELC